MFKFNYNSFKAALKNSEQVGHEELSQDLEKVKAWVEKALTLCLECNASQARTNYPGLEV